MDYATYQTALQKNLREFTREVVEDEANASMFREAIKNYRAIHSFFDSECDWLAREVVNAVPNEKIIANYWFQRRVKERKEAERRISELTWQLKICQGKVRWKEDDIGEIKKIPISNFLSTEWTGDSKRKKAKCPLHNENSPSFTWYVDNNTWFCFGCGVGGDNIDLYMKLNDCDFKTALRALS